MAPTQNEALLLSTEQLEAALAAERTGREGAWVAGVQGQLQHLETMLQRHITLADKADGIFSEVDQTRTGLVRQMNHLRDDHLKFLDELGNLRGEAQRAAQALSRSAPTTVGEAAPDLGTLRQHVEEFMRALNEHSRQESEIILESVTTDIGTGD